MNLPQLFAFNSRSVMTSSGKCYNRSFPGKIPWKILFRLSEEFFRDSTVKANCNIVSPFTVFFFFSDFSILLPKGISFILNVLPTATALVKTLSHLKLL